MLASHHHTPPPPTQMGWVPRKFSQALQNTDIHTYFVEILNPSHRRAGSSGTCEPIPFWGEGGTGRTVSSMYICVCDYMYMSMSMYMYIYMYMHMYMYVYMYVYFYICIGIDVIFISHRAVSEDQTCDRIYTIAFHCLHG